jgi:putative ABC transport system permease protein
MRRTIDTPRSRLRLADLIGTGTIGLRSRPGRALLTALGIAIGVAAIVAITGISTSSKADLIAQIDRLGTNMLQVAPGQSLDGQDSKLPDEAPAMIRRIPPVNDAASTAKADAIATRTAMDSTPNGMDVQAAEPNLLQTLQGSLAAGRFLDARTSGLPFAVLGAEAAKRLGISDLDEAPTISIGGKHFAVIGILQPLPLNIEIDRSVLIGVDAMRTVLGQAPSPTMIYVRTAPDQVEAVRDVLSRTANPLHPNEVQVSRPSDALEARARVDESLRALLLGLGAVALIVGAVGIANMMVISVLERRGEIGLRRAIGATRRHVVGQFVIESISLATFGGLAGSALGVAVTVGYARHQGWMIDLPIDELAAGVGIAAAVGAIAGVYPAIRAARLDPATSVRPS